MKKILAISSALLLSTALASCGSDRHDGYVDESAYMRDDDGHTASDHVNDAIDGVKDAGEDIVEGVGDAAKDVADGLDGRVEGTSAAASTTNFTDVTTG